MKFFDFKGLFISNSHLIIHLPDLQLILPEQLQILLANRFGLVVSRFQDILLMPNWEFDK